MNPMSATPTQTIAPAAAAATPAVANKWPYLRLLRPKQWVKNALVLAPLIFTGSFTHYDAVLKSLLAAVLFCVASSAGYIFNDLRDVEFDRAHPRKKHSRPLAAGEVSTATAKVILLLLYAIVAAAFIIQPALAAVLTAYITLNVAYTLQLKNVPVVDLFVIAFGFVLRAYAGAQSLAVPLSFWMFITTLCGALYLAATKRRQELARTDTASPSAARAVLGSYTAPLLNYYCQAASIGTIIFYGLFVATVRPALIGTIPFVLFGFFRYQYVVEVAGRGESPTEVLWSDVPLLLGITAWVAAAVYALWP